MLSNYYIKIRHGSSVTLTCVCNSTYCPEEGAAEQVVASGILPVLALALRSRGRLTLLTAHLVAELAEDCE